MSEPTKKQRDAASDFVFKLLETELKLWGRNDESAQLTVMTGIAKDLAFSNHTLEAKIADLTKTIEAIKSNNLSEYHYGKLVAEHAVEKAKLQEQVADLTAKVKELESTPYWTRALQDEKKIAELTEKGRELEEQRHQYMVNSVSALEYADKFKKQVADLTAKVKELEKRHLEHCEIVIETDMLHLADEQSILNMEKKIADLTARVKELETIGREVIVEWDNDHISPTYGEGKDALLSLREVIESKGTTKPYSNESDSLPPSDMDFD